MWSDLRCRHGGGGQGEHHERRGGLHGRRQDHRERADPLQVRVRVVHPNMSLLLSVCEVFNSGFVYKE